MTANTALSAPRVSLSAFWAAIGGIWVAATALALALGWFFRQLPSHPGDGLFWLLIALFGFPLFYWVAGARWPSSAHIARFGFALGSAVINCVLAIYGAWLIATLFIGD